VAEENVEKSFAEYPRFFVKVDSACEIVAFDCIDNQDRKYSCKKHQDGEVDIRERITSCLLSYACKSPLSHKRAQFLAANCVKLDTRFKYLGFLSKESLDSFMAENFAPLCEAKPKAVGWKRFLLDVGAVYNK